MSLIVDGRGRKFLVHRLVAIAFIGRPPADRPFVDHVDGVKVNNATSNLEWVSHAENARRAASLGLMKSGAAHGLRVHPDRAPQGERNGGAKLSTNQVLEARRRSEAGDSYRTIAENLRVSITTIGRIVRGELWRSVPEEASR